jgi:hypothetical protein
MQSDQPTLVRQDALQRYPLRMWPGIATAGAMAPCGVIAEFRGLSGTAVQRKMLASRLLAVAGSVLGVDQVNRGGIGAIGIDGQEQHVSRPKASRRHRRRASQAAVPGSGGNADTFNMNSAGPNWRGLLRVEVAFGLHQSALTQGAIVSRKFWSAAISNPKTAPRIDGRRRREDRYSRQDHDPQRFRLRRDTCAVLPPALATQGGQQPEQKKVEVRGHT